MKPQLEQRLEQLKSEFDSGQKMMADLESQQSNLKSTMLRISGAIQVLEEILQKERESSGNGAHMPANELEHVLQEKS